VIRDSMQLQAPATERWSDRVVVVRGLNPGPFTGPGTNTYLVGTGPRPLLIDTGAGLAAYVELLERSLAEAGAQGPGDLVITHAHGDHLGGAASVLERFGRRPVHKLPWPERDRAFDVELTPLREGETVRTQGATLRALHCPGHAQDHLCLYLEEERALFTGDVVLGAGTTVIPTSGGSMRAYMASLERIAQLELERIYPGHGPLILDPRARVQAYLGHRREREEQIVAALRAGDATIERIVERIYTNTPRALHAAAGQSVLSHLHKLEEERRVMRDGASAHWSLCS
jgi:endoribonuclease LACTB2